MPVYPVHMCLGAGASVWRHDCGFATLHVSIVVGLFVVQAVVFNWTFFAAILFGMTQLAVTHRAGAWGAKVVEPSADSQCPSSCCDTARALPG